MFAIINLNGIQYKIEKNSILYVNRILKNDGEIFSINKCICFKKKEKILIGNPFLNCNIKIKILQHFKGKKIIIFKKKRRKGYKVKNGHRQNLSKIQILDIKL
ncbi:50S ribosomal protein L21 [Candidatus Shikimatogenerans silvanidophilus]|uniref:50S ribosomal protein L21 n=1 Tax=Candidatus Shikimatogenerans silvanidophilus TaxID=2782547 RepID=UPI001BB4450C|nr:50S ribosomal protein L21 [Candidatus Shikimatogenerans silvanidophilus]